MGGKGVNEMGLNGIESKKVGGLQDLRCRAVAGGFAAPHPMWTP